MSPMNSTRNSHNTSSKTTLWLGITTVLGVAFVTFLGFVAVPADDVQGEVVRIIFVHVPAAIGAYAAFTVTFIGSIMWLWKRSVWWDITAHSCAEVGVLMCGITLVTGMLWGRPTWGTYWEWGDVRLITTLILFLIMFSYLAIRSTGSNASTKAAVVGILGAANMPIVNRSVDWWANRTLHQQSSLVDGKLEDITLFTLFGSFVVAALAITWMVIHRFRVGWLEHAWSNQEIQEALAERRSEIQNEQDKAKHSNYINKVDVASS